MKFTHEQVPDILADRGNMSASDLKAKYSNFAEECPTLWQKIIDPNADLEMLNTMLRALSNIHNEKSFNDASQKMGFVVFDKYARNSIT